MAESPQDSRSENESTAIAVVRLQERFRSLLDQIAELKEQTKEATATASTAARRVDELTVRFESLVRILSEQRLVVLVRMLEAFEGESTDKKEFDRSLRISVVTMIVSVLAFSVLVPIIQRFILHT